MITKKNIYESQTKIISVLPNHWAGKCVGVRNPLIMKQNRKQTVLVNSKEIPHAILSRPTHVFGMTVMTKQI